MINNLDTPERRRDRVRNKIHQFLLDGKSCDTQTLSNYLDEIFERGHFVDKGVSSNIIATQFKTALAAKDSKIKGLDPVKIPLRDYISVVSAPENTELRNIEKEVFALSFGGSNTKIGGGNVSLNGGLELETFYQKEIGKDDDCRVFETSNDFWRSLFTAEALENLRERFIENPNLIFSVTPCSPVEMTSRSDGHLQHFSEKFRCEELAPYDPEDASNFDTVEFPTMAESLSKFFFSEEINLKTEQIVVSPNDTVSTAFAFASRFKDFRIKNLQEIAALIDGTGCNIFILDSQTGFNMECGEYTGIRPSKLDTTICGNAKSDFDSLVSGNLMGDTFRLAIRALSGSHNPLSKKMIRLDNKAANKLIFSLAYSETGSTGNGLSFNGVYFSSEEVLFLSLVAKKFTDRASTYLAEMLKAMEKVFGKDLVFFTEGSLLTKNPKFVEEITQKAGKEGQDFLLSERPRVTNNAGENMMEDVDASFVGTFNLGLIESLAPQNDMRKG